MGVRREVVLQLGIMLAMGFGSWRQDDFMKLNFWIAMAVLLMHMEVLFYGVGFIEGVRLKARTLERVRKID